jgi:hypothetical protein
MAKTRDQVVRELTLLLMGLTSWEERGGLRCWKNLDFDTLDGLAADGLIDDRPGRKSAGLTDAGEAEVERLAREYRIEEPFGPPKPAIQQLQVLVELQHMEPLVWRRLAVPLTATGLQLHKAIQAAFGWEDRHLHQCNVGDARYGVILRDEPARGVLPSHALKLRALWDGGVREVRYLYDFGDGWKPRAAGVVLAEARGAALRRPRRGLKSGGISVGR